MTTTTSTQQLDIFHTRAILALMKTPTDTIGINLHYTKVITLVPGETAYWCIPCQRIVSPFATVDAEHAGDVPPLPAPEPPPSGFLSSAARYFRALYAS